MQKVLYGYALYFLIKNSKKCSKNNVFNGHFNNTLQQT